MTMHRNHMLRSTPCLLGAMLLACGNAEGSNNSMSSAGDGFTNVNLLVASGQGAAGILPGKAAPDIVDGWLVNYEKVLITIGEVQASRDEVVAIGDNSHFVDLMRVGARGTKVSATELIAGEYTGLEFAILPPSPKSLLTEVTQTDHDMMLKNGYSIYIEGVMTSESGQSCNPEDPSACVPAPKISFKWGLTTAARFTDCLGFIAPAEDEPQVVLTLPMDHWLFTSFAAEAEDAPRRAQWIADADLDGDGETTLEELQAVAATDLFRPDLGYDLDAAASTVTTARDFLEAQVRTMGISSASGCRIATPLD
jgi:hypothetical protein